MKKLSPIREPILQEIIKLVLPGNILEIGTMWGGSAIEFMKVLEKGFLVTVDPYGSKPYSLPLYNNYDFSDGMQRECMKLLSETSSSLSKDWHHFKMTSLQFLRYVQPLRCWYNGEEEKYEWQTVFLDGEHVDKVVEQELQLVYPHVLKGGIIIIDDVHFVQENGKKLICTVEEFAKGKKLQIEEIWKQTVYVRV